MKLCTFVISNVAAIPSILNGEPLTKTCRILRIKVEMVDIQNQNVPHVVNVQAEQKLTKDQVKYILTSSKMQIELAKELGVYQGTISKIRLGNSWKHIN